MELLSNEYHLVGPVASSIKRNDCSLDCKSRMINDASRRRKSVDDRRNGVCGCGRFPRRDPRRDPRSSREDSKLIFHSTRVSADERDNAARRDREFNTDVSDIRDDRRRRDTIRMEQREDAEPIAGPSSRFPGTPSPVPARNAKKARVEDRKVHRADEKDDEADEDMDCTCADTREEHLRIRPPGRRPRVDVEEDEEEDNKGRMEEEEDEDTEEDSVYEELRTRGPRRRPTARERELKRWIRRCRQECERQKGR